MMRRQRGVTAIGWVVLLIPMAIVLYGGIRLAPEYMNYYKVVQALKETATQLQGDESLSVQSIHNALSRRFDTGYIEKPDFKEIEITRGDAGWVMTADYEAMVPMMGNLYLLMQFKTSVPIN